MTLVASQLEALVVARARTAGRVRSVSELVQPLARYAPPELTQAAWRDRLVEIASDLRAKEVLDPQHRLRDTGELAQRIGRHNARTWRQLVERVLPALALGIAADDGKVHARLAGRDAWAAAIVGRVLGLWHDGPPPSLEAMCDALAWRELGLRGKPKRCPPEIRALFIQRRLGSEAGPPERLVRVLAAREVGALSSALPALREALVRSWLAGRTLGPARSTGDDAPDADEVMSDARPQSAAGGDHAAAGFVSDGQPRASADEAYRAAGEAHDSEPRSFAGDVLQAAGAVRDGWLGDRKVFVSAIWHELHRNPRWSALTLDEFKARLVAAHRAGELVLERADFVPAMDPELVATSEITVDGASFHFLVKEPVT
jgi:hypothetical protein